MSEKSQALRLINDLLADIRDPSFVWQVVTLVACIGSALLIARWWHSRHTEGEGRLTDAGARLVFPLTGMLLTGIALSTLGSFMHLNLLKLAMPLLGSMALVRGVIFVLRQAFPRATWLTAWERIIAATVWGWLALYITDLAPFVIEAMESVQFHVGKQQIDLWTVLRGIATVFLTVVFALWIAGLVEAKLMRIQSLDVNLRIVGVRVAKAVLTVVAILTSLALVGIDMTALSVFTGALGVGLGFGLQKIASNYVSGFIILLDRSIRIGNIVQVGSDSGEVTQITTRYTVLKHPGGTEFIVPNETLIGSIVQNQTYSNTCIRLVSSVGVAYDSDLDLACRLMVDAAQNHPRALSDPPPKVFLTQFADSAINLEVGFWINDPEEGKGNIVSDVNFAIWRAFKENGIGIPFPQRDIRIISSS
ncbi:mechanosensitive ion channel family protein [Dechloromonas sp. ARDL1]|uniref:mechanosensitive ion channel family protein n=1 Tax=Dechloromonas sp. ARDL1 TaxID=3322121 RepID=UPI003DA6FC88